MKSNPFFSIVIPVFNRADLIGGALESVLAQEFQDYEVIVVDDGSIDELEPVIEKYTQRGVQFLRNDKNLGVGPTRNKGVRASRGRWVIFFDSDNRLRPGALSILHSAAAGCDEKVGVVHGKSELVGVSTSLQGLSQASTRWGYREYLQADVIEEALPATRRDVLLRFPFEEKLGIKRECGSLVWYAIGRAGYDFVWTQAVVQRYVISADSLSGKPYLAAHPEEMVICNQKILERFGDDLRCINKEKLIALHQKTAFYCIMAGRSGCALRHAQTALKLDPINLRTLLLMTLCWVSPRTARRLYPLAASVGV
jgi:glycosyltransferase involved in cell wall biosynthesis